MGPALEGVRVLEVAAYLAGPYVGSLLGWLGAEVIKVEPPGKGDRSRVHEPVAGSQGIHTGPAQTADDMSISILKRARNKKSITLDLKNEEGRQLFLQLATKADVILENFQPGTMRRLGVDYEAVKPVNPGIIYCSVSGFGQTGPYSEMLAFDPIVQAMCGLMSINGQPDSPPVRSGLTAADLAPPLFGALSIVTALHHRQRSRTGQYIDVSMLDCLISMLFEEHLDCMLAEGINLRFGNRLPRTEPMDCYPTKDGYVFIVCAVWDHWQRLLEALGAQHLAGDPALSTNKGRGEHRAEIDSLIKSWTTTRTTEEAMAALIAHEVPSGPVRTIPEVMEDAHVKQRGILSPLLHPLLDEPVGAVAANFPVKFSDMPLQTPRPAPVLGMHNEEIYGGVLGLPQSELNRLRREGVI